MATVRRPLGFADLTRTAEFFGVTSAEVRQLAESGDWPSWMIAGKRVFDLDELVEKLARAAIEEQRDRI